MDVSSVVRQVIELAVQIQQIPGPTFGERKRAEFIYNHFQELGANDVSYDDRGNVYTHLSGLGNQPPLVVTAHLDTVFPAETDLTCDYRENRISGPGIGDNSLGLAGLIGLYRYFTGNKNVRYNDMKLPGDLWLVANVGEEGLGDLLGMKAVVDRFKSEVLAYIVLEGMTLGHIYTRGLGVRRYRISVHTRGGHSWTDYGSPSAIHEIADLIVKLKNIPISTDPRSSMNVGMIRGGTSVNTIAAEASLELDLRSESSEMLAHLIEQVDAIVNVVNSQGGDAVQVRKEIIGDRPAGEISNTQPLVKLVMECFARAGMQVKLKTGSTDANVPLSRGYPAICFGLTTGSGAHTLGEYIETSPVLSGFTILIDLVQSAYQIRTGSRPMAGLN